MVSLSDPLAEYIDHSKHDPEKVVEVSPNGRYAKVNNTDNNPWRTEKKTFFFFIFHKDFFVIQPLYKRHSFQVNSFHKHRDQEQMLNQLSQARRPAREG
jgi:hypothetical protein